MQTLGGAPQCFGAPDGARGARPMALKQGNQAQWLGSSRVGTLMRQDIFMDSGKANSPRRPEGTASRASPKRSQIQSSWGVQTYAQAKSGPQPAVYGTNPNLPNILRRTPEKTPDQPPPAQPLAETGLNRQVQAYATVPSLNKMYYTDPSPLPVPRKTQFNRSDLVRNRVEHGDCTDKFVVDGRRREVGFGESIDKPMQTEFYRPGYNGKVCDWSMSGDAPQWMLKQSLDKNAVISAQVEKQTGMVTSFKRDGNQKGSVTDWSISADGPAWMTDVLEKYDKEAILDPVVLKKGKQQFFSVSKSKNNDVTHAHATLTRTTFDRQAAGIGSMGGHTITDSSTSADMPSYLADQSRRILGKGDVLEPPENSNKNWYNRQSYGRKPKFPHQHASYQSKKERSIGMNGGLGAKAEHHGGNVISDSTVSGEAPAFMVDMSKRVDPTCVYTRPNNQLHFVNQEFSTGEKPSQWTYDDSSVSGDAPSWMTETSARISDNILVEPTNREWVNSSSNPSYRKSPKKPVHEIRAGRSRTKPTKWTTDVERHTMMNTRKPYQSPKKTKRWVR